MSAISDPRSARAAQATAELVLREETGVAGAPSDRIT